MLWSRISFRLSVRQVVSRIILRGCALVNFLLHPIWAQHVIPGADSFLLLLDGHALEVGDLPLHILDRRALVDGLDVQRDHHAALQVQEVRQHPVCQFRRENLQERHGPIGPADLEHPAIFEGEAVRGDEILAGKAGFMA